MTDDEVDLTIKKGDLIMNKSQFTGLDQYFSKALRVKKITEGAQYAGGFHVWCNLPDGKEIGFYIKAVRKVS